MKYGMLVLGAVCSATPALAQSGRVIAIGDEWLVSNLAFGQFPSQSGQLAENIANYFADGGPSDYAVFSTNAFAYGTSLAAKMTSLGHTWTVNPAQPFTLATLQQYDGVFLAGSVGSGAANAPALVQYVQQGGNVMVMAGTGQLGGAPGEAAAWAPFLNQFGLAFGTSYFGLRPGAALLEVPANPTVHPLGTLITTVLWGFGQTAIDLDAVDPLNEVALFGNFTGFPSPPPSGDVANQSIIATYNVNEPAPGCLGDENEDGTVDFDDLNRVLSAFSSSGPIGAIGDENEDGVVDFDDLNNVLSNFGNDC